MTCQERRDELLLYVAGALEPGEAAELRGHLLTGCPVCAGALAEAEAVVHRIPEGLEPVGVPADAWGRVEKRMRTREAATGGGSRAWWGAAAAVAAVVIVSGALLKSVNQQLRDAELRASGAMSDNKSAMARAESAERDLSEARGVMTAAQNQVKALNVRMAGLETQVKELRRENDGTKLELASVQGEMKSEMMKDLKHIMDSEQYEVAAKDMKDVQGMVYICRGDGECMLVASNLKALPAGKTFEAWMIDDKGKAMPAGTFTMDGDGMAMHMAKIPAGMSMKGTFAVTDEPGLMAQPTGSVLFMAEIK